LLSGADSMLASLGKAYEEELGTAGERLEETTMGWAENFRDRLSKVTNAGELGNLFDNLLVTGASVSGDLDKTTQNALADRFSHMLPTVEAIQDSIASYYDENGEQLSAIPQNVMDTYYQMMEIGASAGDDGAVAAIVAKQIASAFGDREAFDNALSNAGITMDFMSGLFGGSLVDEINRAFAETTDEVDYSMLLDGIVGAISGEEPDFTKVEELLNTYGYSISNSLKEQGIDLEGEIPVNTEGVTADIDELSKNLEGLNYVGTTTLSGGEIAFQYTINEGETLSGIMEQYGIVWKDVEQQFLEANPEITDPNLIYPNQVINIPEEILLEAAEVDASAVGEAAEEAAKSEASKTIEEEQGVKNTLTDAGVDSTQVGKAAEEAAKSGTGEVIEREQPTQTTMTNAGVDDSQIMQAAEEKETAAEPKEQNVPTTIKFEVVSLDNSEIASAVSEKLLEGEAVPVSVPVDVTSRMGTDNFDETANSFASKFESALRSAFSRTFYATTNASITVDYSIANPSKTITFSGGGSGTATVYAHALGGIFDTPHYGVFAEAGPEAFIPLDGSDNAKMIWKEAGERLGLLGGDEPLSIAPAVLKGGGTGGEKEGQGSHRTVDININGSGKLSVTGGLSKDEVISILIENMRDVLSDIVEQDMFVEGDGSYAY